MSINREAKAVNQAHNTHGIDTWQQTKEKQGVQEGAFHSKTIRRLAKSSKWKLTFYALLENDLKWHQRNPPEGVFWWVWKHTLSWQSGMSSLALWMYMLYPKPGEHTILWLLPGNFLWPLHPVALPQTMIESSSSGDAWKFLKKNKKNPEHDRVVWLSLFSLLCDSWQEVWKQCHSFLICFLLIRLAALWCAYCWWPVMSL